MTAKALISFKRPKQLQNRERLSRKLHPHITLRQWWQLLKKSNLKQFNCYQEFLTGSIVSINRRGTDYGWFKVRKNALVLYGVVEARGKEESEKEISDTNEMINFVVSGEYEWYNKNNHNVITSAYHTGLLKMYFPPPNNSSDQHPFSDKYPLRLFTKTVCGWKVKWYEEPCYTCGLPWYFYDRYKAGFKKLIKLIGDNGDCVTNSQCHYKCYKTSTSKIYRTLGYHNKRRIWWCYESAVIVYLDTNYTKYKETGNDEKW